MSSSAALAGAVRQALSEGLGSAQIQAITTEECINEVDYAGLEDEPVVTEAPAPEKPKRKRRPKNASD